MRILLWPFGRASGVLPFSDQCCRPSKLLFPGCALACFSMPRLNQFEERRSIRHRGLLFSRDPAQPSAFLRKKSMPACQSLLRNSVARLLKHPAKMQSAFGTTRADRLGGFCSGGFPQPRRMVFAFRRGEHQCPETDEDIRLSIVQWNKQKLLSVHNGW
jgi:hypothetical protein